MKNLNYRDCESLGTTQNNSKKILVLCPFPVGVAAGQRLKYEQYFDDWRSLGYEIVVSPFMDLSMWNIVYSSGNYSGKALGFIRGQIRRCKVLLRISKFDIVYIFMWVTPFGTSFFERLVRKISRKIIYDIEDNLLVGQSRVSRDSHPHWWVSMLKSPDKTKFLLKYSDHIITSSPYLNEICLGINKKKACTYVSSSVDTEMFLPATVYSNARTVVIGWTGTFSSKVYLDLLRNVFIRLSERVNFKLKIIGNFEYELKGIDLEVVRWTREREVQELQTFDIGVYPLTIDDWVLGKSGLKAIQYMAFGLPIVATNVGTTSLLIDDAEDGLLVESEDEWVDALERLVCQPDLRRRLGQAARKKAVEKYSVNSVKGKYREVLSLVTQN